MREETRRTADYLIGLLKSVLDGTAPEEKPEDITFEQLYRLAGFHQVRCMAYYGVKKLKVQPEMECRWKRECDQHIVKSMVQLSERDRIIEKLTGAGIDLLPLKGCLLKEMYPQADYREMADLDMLFDTAKAELAKKQMEALGYTAEYFEVSNHDVYHKPPYMGVELHRDMLNKHFQAHGYYKGVWEKAIPEDKNPHCFRLSWDDYYIFLLTHFAKHYYYGGSGIRSIMDIHVFLSRHEGDLNQCYLEQELKKLDLLEFRETAEQLARYWFADGLRTERIEEMAEYVITSGMYGTRNRVIENGLKNAENSAGSAWRGRVSYVCSRIFQPYRSMCRRFPVLKKVPVLLPLCWVLRLILAVVRKRKQVQAELRILTKREK